MFADWKAEKAVQALVDEAQAWADRLSSAKPHQLEAQAAAGWYWAAFYLSEGRDLTTMAAWKPLELKRFVTATQTKIAALRKARDYEVSDGLTLWLHAARAVTEPRIAPPAAEIWALIAGVGQNADTMAEERCLEAGIPYMGRILAQVQDHESP